MKIRKFITPKADLIQTGKSIIQSNDDPKYLFRVFAVNLVLSGISSKLVAENAGVTRDAVNNWVRSVDKKGFESLKDHKKTGRNPKLSTEQLKEINDVLLTDPKNFGYKVWDGPSLSKYIFDTYNIEISVRQSQRLFHILGFSKIRPQTYPSKGKEDSEAREEYKKKFKK